MSAFSAFKPVHLSSFFRSAIGLALLSVVISHIYAAPAGAQTDGFVTVAPHVVLLDSETGLTLFEKDARKAIAPASMTKIMTAALIFDRIRDGSINKDTMFAVSEEAWRRGGAASGSSTMFLELGSQVSVENLLRGVIIQSGNDACIVLAEGIAGSETAFADLMTQRAHELGLKSANFENATGWPHPEHEISALDLAKLAQYVITQYPEFYSLYSERSFEWNGISQANRNPLLGRFTGADGIKTGYTEVSKYGLVGSAKRGGQRIVMVVNGLETNALRTSESVRIMQAGFESFKVYDLFEQNDKVGQAPVFMGKSDNVDLIAAGNITTGFHRSLRNDMVVTISYDGPLAAPIAAGEKVGHLHVSVPGQDKQAFDLLAGQSIERKGLFGRAITSLKQKFGG